MALAIEKTLDAPHHPVDPAVLRSYHHDVAVQAYLKVAGFPIKEVS
jgi:hypothetical protein